MPNVLASNDKHLSTTALTIIALLKSANKNIEEKGLNEAALKDVILARTGRSMIQSSGKLEAIKTGIEANLPYVKDAKHKSEYEEILKEFGNYFKLRESLEKQFFDYAHKAIKNPADLTEKMSAVTKLGNSLEAKGTDKLKEMLQNIPGKSVTEELRKILNPDENERPRLET